MGMPFILGWVITLSFVQGIRTCIPPTCVLLRFWTSSPSNLCGSPLRLLGRPVMIDTSTRCRLDNDRGDDFSKPSRRVKPSSIFPPLTIAVTVDSRVRQPVGIFILVV